MNTPYQLHKRNDRQFNPFEHPAVMNELDTIFRSMLPYAGQNKAWLLCQFLRHHSINRIMSEANPPLIQNIVKGTCSIAATESLFAVNEGNKPFCNDLENYILLMLR